MPQKTDMNKTERKPDGKMSAMPMDKRKTDDLSDMKMDDKKSKDMSDMPGMNHSEMRSTINLNDLMTRG